MVSLIANIVTFVSVCVLFACFMRSNKRYAVLYDKYICLKNKYICLKKENEARYCFCSEKAKELDDLRTQLARYKRLDSITNMAEVDDYKSVLLAVTKEYERQHNCSIDRAVVYESGSYKRVRVEI